MISVSEIILLIILIGIIWIGFQRRSKALKKPQCPTCGAQVDRECFHPQCPYQ